ncbi:unnamed protein product [Mytilus edulis]|uniref:Uncharacterized protein n=1 Tax=Mytilus edulis TaxID=6550 RepID=A0A8S3RGG4_MYTED|nr:unnamed protein product [Mytilus edulis]
MDSAQAPAEDINRDVSLMIINNSGKKMIKPQYVTSSGRIDSNPPSSIPSFTQSYQIWFKKNFGLRGSEGVLSYEIENTEKRLFIFYSNPFLGHNGFRLMIKSRDVATDLNQSNKMLHDEWPMKNEMSEMSTGSDDDNYFATGNMSQGDPAKLTVYLKTKQKLIFPPTPRDQ